MTATTDARCQNNARLCASSTRRGKTTALSVCCAQPYYHLSFQSKGYDSQTFVEPRTAGRRQGNEKRGREEQRAGRHVTNPRKQKLKKKKKHLQQLRRLSIYPLGKHSLSGHFGCYAPPLRHGSPCVWGMQLRSPSAYYGCQITLSSSFLEYFAISGQMRISLLV